MQKLIDTFSIMQGDKEIDRFDFYTKDNNHGSISNRSGCLFDGYILEAQDVWEKKREDMKLVEMLGLRVV